MTTLPMDRIRRIRSNLREIGKNYESTPIEWSIQSLLQETEKLAECLEKTMMAVLEDKEDDASSP